MDLLEQCRLWHEAEEHEKIVQALEALPEEQRTAATDMELARAYNNLAQPAEPEGRELLRRAIRLMAAHESDCPDPYSWNFRMGYACYYLDREGAALGYLERALELHPGDSPKLNSREDVRQLIDDCRRRLTLPRFERPFQRRVIEAWAEFARREEQVRRLLDAGEQDEARALTEGALCCALAQPHFSLRRGEGYELILSPEGDRARLFQLIRFVRQTPPPLARHWKVLVDLASMEDVPGAPEQGETADPAPCLENSYVTYHLEPNEDPDADWRLDVIAGSTRCPALVRQYLAGESAAVDLLHDDGAAAGFICWPLEGVSPEERGQQAFALRGQLEETLAALGEEKVTLLGGAMGLFCGYLDLIAWDLPAVLDAAAAFFAASGLAWGSFHSFRRDVGTVRLWNAEDEKEPEVHPETGSLLSPQDIETMESYLEASSGYFYQVLQYLTDFIEKGKKEGRFTERQARRDLQIALWYAYACLNVDEYEYYYRASQWMPDSEPAAKGCGTWYYRYAASLMYCGRLEEARKYAEQGTVEEPDYPWAWLLTAKLRSHFGEKEAALAAVEQGLELVPGDYEFLTLRREIEAGATLEQMENHWIDPDFDQKLQAGQDEGAAAKLQAISCIVLDKAGLEAFFELFAPDEEDYTPNAPYCSFHRTVRGRRLDVLFLMNEAGLSKLGRDWLRHQRDRLDSGEWLDLTDPEGKPGRLETVLFGLDRSVRLLGHTKGNTDGRFQTVLDEAGNAVSCEWMNRPEQPEDEEEPTPQWVYTEHQMELVEEHIRRHVGPFDQVLHELVSPDIHVDLCIVPPDDDRNFYTIITMGMGARRMNVPPELAEHRLERAELAIALPDSWKLDQESLQDERWYWPLRLLKSLARLPGACNTWLGWGHTVDNQEPYAPDTGLCAALLVGLQGALPGGDVCPLPDGDEINIYQVIPLYRAEMEYKQEKGAEALLDHMNGVSFVVMPDRPCAALEEQPADAFLLDNAEWHLQSLRRKHLAVEPIAVYDHMAIYLRWCIERGLMSGEFLAQHGALAGAVRQDGAGTDLRSFIRDALGGKLWSNLFSEEGQAFASYYYGENEAPSFPSDIDNWSLDHFGPVRYQSDEFQDEAYLFVPFNEGYYQGMAALMDRRRASWLAQDIPGDGQPPEAAAALMEQLEGENCYFPPMKDPDPLLADFGYTRRQAIRDGYIPLFLAAEDGLWQSLRDLPLPQEPAAGTKPFARLWGEDGLTRPVVLARVPASAPWEVFEKLPLGESGPRLAALARRWYQQYGAVPAALGCGWVEFTLPDVPPKTTLADRDRLALALAGRRPVRLTL